MAKGKVLHPIFKMYHQRQAMLLPPSLDELIAANHPVRVVDDVLSKIDIRPLIRQYKTGGASSYHPGMLLKVLVYAYINNIYSSRKIEAYVKYNQFDTEQNANIQSKRTFGADKLHYNAGQDYYVCLMGQHMESIGVYTRKTSTGYLEQVKKYSAKNCNSCPLNGSCHKSQGNRTIEINHNLNRLKLQASEKLLSEEGIKKRKQRCHDVEPIFGNIKNNHGFKRFMLRGKEKVCVETGLPAPAHNLRKKAINLKLKQLKRAWLLFFPKIRPIYIHLKNYKHKKLYLKIH